MLQDRRIYKTPDGDTFFAISSPYRWLLESYPPKPRAASPQDPEAASLEHLVVRRAGELFRIYYATSESCPDEGLAEFFREQGWDWKDVRPYPCMKETGWTVGDLADTGATMTAQLLGHMRFLDGARRPIYAEGDRQYTYDNDGEQVYG